MRTVTLKVSMLVKVDVEEEEDNEKAKREGEEFAYDFLIPGGNGVCVLDDADFRIEKIGVTAINCE